MKILFISPQFPYPLDVGSRIRVFNLIKAYSKKHEVTLVSFIKKDEHLEHSEIMRKYCKEIHAVPLKTCYQYRQSQHKALRAVYKLLDNIPFSVRCFYSKEMSGFLDSINFSDYDLVHIERVHMCHNIKELIKKNKERQFKIVLDVDDYESKKKYRELKLMRFSKNKLLSLIEFIKLRLYEKFMLPKFDSCLLCSEVDKKAMLERIPSANFTVIPNGINPVINGTQSASETENQMLYIGAMNYEPNSDAVLYFYSRILPYVKQEIPIAKFIIAGKDPFREVMDIHNGTDVFVTGYVNDISQIMAESSLFVVPLRVGGGTRIKILEAMSMGKAVISTSVGCEGINVTDGKDIFIADEPADFADKCVRLLRDRQKRIQMGESARILAERYYDWTTIGNKLLDLLLSLEGAKESDRLTGCENPLVSVIIPAYNRAKVISQAIDSVLTQTYKNMEIIVVDDGSKDNIKEAIAPYEGRIRYFYKKNGGASSARNFGIKQAKGEYIGFLDSDDLWYPIKLEKQIDKLRKNPDCAVAISETELIDDGMNHISYSNLRDTIIKDGDILKYILQSSHFGCGSSMLVKKEVFDEVGSFDESFKTANDFEIIIRICSKFKVVLVDEPLIKYKKSDNSISHRLFSGNRLKAIEKLSKYAPDFVKDNKRVILSVKAEISLSYADDLLWNRYLKESRKQIIASLRDCFSIKAILLYGKNLVIEAVSIILPQYKDKGIFKISGV